MTRDMLTNLALIGGALSLPLSRRARAVIKALWSHQTERTFTFTLTSEDGWYVAQCREVDVASQGKTEHSALVNVLEALRLKLLQEFAREERESGRAQAAIERWIAEGEEWYKNATPEERAAAFLEWADSHNPGGPVLPPEAFDRDEHLYP